MARTHARTKGKSGSTRPAQSDLSVASLKAKDVEKMIVNFVKNDAISTSKIGLILRDKYAVPSVKALCGKSISKIVADAKLEPSIPEDLAALVKKALALTKHLDENSRDTHNKRGLILIDSKIRRLSTYYKNKNRIPKNWSYK